MFKPAGFKPAGLAAFLLRDAWESPNGRFVIAGDSDVRAVLQILTGPDAGRRFPIQGGSAALSSVGVRDAVPSAGPTARLERTGDEWLLRDEAAAATVNGRQVSEAVVADRDILGVGRRLLRLYVLEDGPSAPAPRRTLAVPGATPKRRGGLSTVVTAPGRWGSVSAAWIDDVVLRLRGGPDPHPERMIARLNRRVRCYAMPDGPGHPVPLDDPEGGDLLSIRERWDRGRFVVIASPLEPALLAICLPTLGPLLHPAGRAEAASLSDEMIEAVRQAGAAVLYGGPWGWELVCCPEMASPWSAAGLPVPPTGGEGSPWDYRTEELASGLTAFRGRTADIEPDVVAAALSCRAALYLIVDAARVRLPESLPSAALPGPSGSRPLLVGPDAGEARFDVLRALWGSDAMIAVTIGRSMRDVGRLLKSLPAWLEPADRIGEALTHQPGSAGLDGLRSVLLAPDVSRWTVFTDPRPLPVWRQYGLPTPTLDA